MSTAFENQNYIIGCAATRPCKQKLHWTCSAIVAATLGSAIHSHDMTAASAGDKEHAILIVPLYCCLHGFLRVAVKKFKASILTGWMLGGLTKHFLLTL